jgi:hypothetical protein
MSELGALKLQNEIDKRMGDLVIAGEDLIQQLGDSVTQIKEAQFRNVMAVANSAPHTAIVTSFIRYQMGRRETQRAWKETGLGDRLINLIDSSMAELAKAAVGKSGFGDPSEVQMQLTRLLLGFMNRRYVYEYDQRRSAARKGGKR